MRPAGAAVHAPDVQMPGEASAMHALSSSYSRQAASSAGSSGGAHSPSRRFPAVSRSIPIAIRRNASSAGDTTTSDEDDGDDNYDDNRMTGASSSKSGLLRAPYLGSLPSNAEFLLSNQSMLLPAASLTREDAAATTATASASYSAGMTTGRTGYGSLRESNLMGRFMDGPSSYRERRTGGIVQLRNRSQFDGTSSSYSASATASTSKPNNPVSIGDQIMMHARRRQDSIENEAQQPSSSLAAMLESSTLEDQPASGNASTPGDLTFIAASVQHVEEAPASVFGEADSVEPDVISMSLTGLEVLHSLRHLSGSATQGGHSGGATFVRQDLEHLPLDENGRNAFLSRSVSDPTPQFRRLDQRCPVYPPAPADHVPLPSIATSTFATTPGPFSTATAFDSQPVPMNDATTRTAVTFAASSIPAPLADAFPTPIDSEFSSPGAANDAILASGPGWEDSMAPPATNDNPDTEGAFEMDLE
jgi:hypothetical protein